VDLAGITSDRGYQHAAIGSTAAISPASPNSGSSNKAHIGFLSRTYGSRPASNPSPSRPAQPGQLSGPAGPRGAQGGSARNPTPGRSPGSSSSSRSSNRHNLGSGSADLADLFTAQALKIPQQLGELQLAAAHPCC
jgi:hypothetical protein